MARKLPVYRGLRWVISQGAEAKVYYREGNTSVVKERTSIYSKTQKALIFSGGRFFVWKLKNLILFQITSPKGGLEPIDVLARANS